MANSLTGPVTSTFSRTRTPHTLRVVRHFRVGRGVTTLGKTLAAESVPRRGDPLDVGDTPGDAQVTVAGVMPLVRPGVRGIIAYEVRTEPEDASSEADARRRAWAPVEDGRT